MIQSPQVAELIDGAYLVKVRAHAPSTPDLSGVRAQAGDYVESQLAGRTDRAKLIADSVGSWLKFGERCTLFCDGRRAFHSAGDEFIKEGGRAEHINGSTPEEERGETPGACRGR
jgi:DNA repair protein RadD